MATFNVRTDLFRAVAIVKSDEETRFYLKGVFIHPHPVEGVYLVATDGHRMLVAHDAGGTCSKPVIVSIEGDALKAGKAKRSDHPSGRRFVAVDEDIIRVTMLGERDREFERAWRVDGTYPDWQRVLPKPEDMKVQTIDAFNPAYLGDFAKALAELLIDMPVMAIRTSEKHGPALVTFGERDDLFGVIMPVTINESRTWFPYFMSPNYTKREAAE